MNAPLFRLEVDDLGVPWRVARVRMRERMCAPFEITVDAEVALADDETPEISLDELIVKDARLAWDTRDGERAVVASVVEATRQESQWTLVLAPRVALLADAVDFRTFLDVDAVTIARAVLEEKGVRLDARVARALPVRAQCVQSFESDLAFVTRVLADEGIAWFCPPEGGAAIVATDHTSGFDRLDGDLPTRDAAGMVGGPAVQNARVASRVVPDAVTLRDYDFTKPQLELSAASRAGTGDLEAYEFPGAFRDPQLGRTLAEMRLAELRGDARVLTGEATARELSPGRIVTLESALPGVAGEWLVVEVEHEGNEGDDDADDDDDGGGGAPRYVARFRAVPADAAYRPPRNAPPRDAGVQTATSTGAAGQEILTDEHARIKALFRWDRRRRKDDHASAWTRTLQPATSGGFMLPRVGWEVLVGFTRGVLDEPLVLGRVYNGEAPPPAALPAHKTVTAFGSLTSPGGGSQNLLALDDTAGKEAMSFVASKDWNERTENDRVIAVVANESDVVGGNRTMIVGQVHELGVKGAQTHTVSASRDLKVDAQMIVAAGPESITVGAARIFKVNGDENTSCTSLTRLVGGEKIETAIEHQTRTVSGASSVTIGGSWVAVAGKSASVEVGGASVERVGGPKSVSADKKYFLQVKGSLTQSFASRTVDAGGDHMEGFAGKATYAIGGSAKVKGADVIVVADEKITLTADGITIEITSGAVKIKGDFDGSVSAVDSGEEKYA